MALALAGWLARRIIAIAVFPPLVGLWYGIFAFLLRLPPGFLGLRNQAQGELVIAAVIAALISDFLIVRAAKRAMDGRKGPPARG